MAKAPKKRKVKGKGKGKRANASAREKRAAAARKGWETRRRKEAEARLDRAERSDRARKGWETRRKRAQESTRLTWDTWERLVAERSPNVVTDTQAWREKGYRPDDYTRLLGYAVLRLYEPAAARLRVNAAWADGTMRAIQEHWLRTQILPDYALPLLEVGCDFRGTRGAAPAPKILNAIFQTEFLETLCVLALPTPATREHDFWVRKGSEIVRERRARYRRAAKRKGQA